MPAALFGAIRLLCPDRESAGATLESLGRGVEVSRWHFSQLAWPRRLSSGPVLAFSVRSSRPELGPLVLRWSLAPCIALTLLACRKLAARMHQLVSGRTGRSPAALRHPGGIRGRGRLARRPWLNAGIPFPANFQVPSIYSRPRQRTRIDAAQFFPSSCALSRLAGSMCVVPFTLYFSRSLSALSAAGTAGHVGCRPGRPDLCPQSAFSSFTGFVCIVYYAKGGNSRRLEMNFPLFRESPPFSFGR